MEHPLIGSLEDLTEEQLRNKVSELHSKLAIAYRTGNGYLCEQLRMALESYNNKYQEKLRRGNPEGDQFNDIIDIQ